MERQTLHKHVDLVDFWMPISLVARTLCNICGMSLRLNYGPTAKFYGV